MAKAAEHEAEELIRESRDQMRGMTAPDPKKSVLVRMAGRYGVDPDKMVSTLKATAFKQKGKSATEVTNEQMMALCIVAEQHGLNPWTREIYAFPDSGAIVLIVGVDGWMRIVNGHRQLDGMEFEDVGETMDRELEYSAYQSTKKVNRRVPEGIACVIYRKDRQHPTRVTEWFDENFRATEPWATRPRRMLRHRAMIQCARVAFSLSGIYEPDEAEAFIEGEYVETGAGPSTHAEVDNLNATLRPQAAPRKPTKPEVEDAEIIEPEAQPDMLGGDKSASAQESEKSDMLKILERVPLCESIKELAALQDEADDTLAGAGLVSVTRSIDKRVNEFQEAQEEKTDDAK